ncbi:MAG: sensor histidine kinase [Velocimicrobium sp.]
MNICRDKQIRHFCIVLLSFSFLLFLTGIGLNTVHTKAVQHLFISHDRAVATSLLEQGVSKDVIAKAITHTATSKEGIDLLGNIGITEHTAVRFLPFISEFQQITGYSMLLIGVALFSLLFGGTYIFFRKREELYHQAEQVITRFVEGDYSCHMPQMKEGSIYRLFASIDQLATLLQSKNETEQKTKVFLKNTISDISHQLKTPLAALIMYYEIISDEPNNADTVKEYSARTGLALNRMEQLIQSMLKITRLDAGSIVFEQNCCHVSELISLSIRELTARAAREEKEILIDRSLKDTIVCDKHWTSEAIGNIIKNALDHTNSGGKIHISWEHTPTLIRIFISDNGMGIALEDLHHIFKRFYRSKKSMDTQGVGLGLSLAKSIVEEQGGFISVQSTLYKGTIFTLSFLTKL